MKDANGFYYVENNEKIRWDEKGNSYAVKQNFAYKLSDNSLRIGAQGYTYDEHNGYFCIVDKEDNRLITKRNVVHVIDDDYSSHPTND